MRSIWKGSISFGLVTIPVKLYSATQENDVSFHQVHRTDGGRIRYRRVCSLDGEEVTYGDIAKGYEMASGEVVVLTDEDFADLPLSTSRMIDVLQFVPLEQVDPIFFAKSYYLEPEAAGTRPYVLLRDALESSGRVALVKIALRQRESLATLRVRDGVFVLEMMLWPDEIRSPDFGFLDDDVEVRPQELQMATSLIDTLAADFEPDAYTDNYREALQTLIEAKVEGREVVTPAEAPTSAGTVVDLMSALRASVEAAKSGRADADRVGAAASARATRAPAAPTATPAAAKSTGAKPTGKKDTAAAKKGTAKKGTAAAKKGTAQKGTAAAKKGPAAATKAAARTAAKGPAARRTA